MTARRTLGGALLALPLLAATLAAFAAGPAPAPAQQQDCPAPSGEVVTLEFIDHEVQRVGVPAGVGKVVAQVRGGHGGYTSSTGKGGRGGLVEGSIPASGGDCLEVYVGGYGGGSRWGYAFGGVRGEQQFGPGRDADGGGGASAVVLGDKAMIVAGGGGGGGGDGSAEFDGGAGGDGAGGAGPGTPNGGDGGNGQGVPVTYFVDLGGLGGYEDGHGGAGGENGYGDPFAGAGGGGGAGWHGGGAGAAWQGTADKNQFKPVGGGGGGGGDSYADPAVDDAVFSVANVDCAEGGHGPLCNGEVVLSWVLEPANITPYMGSGQSATISTIFGGPLSAKVTAANGQPLPNNEVVFTLPDSGPSGEFSSGGTTATATTDANGVAYSPLFYANDEGGSWSATATVEGVSKPARFPLENAPARTSMGLFPTALPAVSGQEVRFVASVAASPSSAGIPLGVVQFEVDGAPLGGAAQLGPTGLAESDPIALEAGHHQVVAKYEGTPEFASSTSEISPPVERALATVSLSSSRNPLPAGESVTITAQIGAAPPGSVGPDGPTGSVRFAVDGEDTGPPVPVSASGSAEASFSLDEGHHLVTATYSGDAHLRSATGAMIQVAGDEVTATEVTSSDPVATYGDPLSLTARVSGPGPLTGAVTFRAVSGDGTQQLCENVEVELVSLDGIAECEPADPLDPGDYRITASYAPDQSGVGPSTGQTTQHVARAAVDATTAATPNPIVFGSEYELHTDISVAPAAGDPDGAVRFAIDGSPVGQPVSVGPFGATLAGDALPGLDAGAHTVLASYEGSTRFAPATSTAALVVDPAPTTTSLRSSSQGARARSPVRFTADVALAGAGAGAIEGVVQFWIDGAPFGPPVPVQNGSATSRRATQLTQGEHDVHAWFASSGNFAPSTAQMVQRTGPPKPKVRQLPCAPAKVLLADVHRRHGVTFVNGVADPRLAGRRVRLMRGSKTVGWTSVLTDGTFWARIKGAGAPGPGAVYSARLGGSKSRWRAAKRIRIIAREPAAQRQRGKARVTLGIGVGARRLAVGRQLRCGRGSSKELRRVRSPGRGERRTITLRRPRAGRPFAVYRVWTPGGRHYSPPIVVRARPR